MSLARHSTRLAFQYSKRVLQHRPFHQSSRWLQQQQQQQRKKTISGRFSGGSLLTRKVLSIEAWNTTEVKWYPIPVGLGMAVIAYIQYRHVREREDRKLEQESAKPKYTATGPWQVHVAAALPLRSMSRLWGAFNSLTIPTSLRPTGFKLYSWIFGCNLEEMKNPNLYTYPNLSAFFYRELKDGARPLAESTLVSPSDGRVLHFGKVEEREIEQIKGVTYSLDALLGLDEDSLGPSENAVMPKDSLVVDEEAFANVNGIQYSLHELIGSDDKATVRQDGLSKTEHAVSGEVEKRLLRETDLEPVQDPQGHGEHKVKPGHGLFFAVVYLAPGDYHRFHSPVNWVVQTRRHFAGELFSVSPYFVNLLKNLFVLNERVVLLGKWRYGFFSMIPVGATNVGSIKINFDETLKTNKKEDIPMGTFTEVTYRAASQRLGGKPLERGEEMGGFYLGSTVVLVFEAPLNFKFNVKAGQYIKMGESLGDIEEEEDSL
ncbi:phosphatidylserine decarboxylase [Hesseltinella vesiculosa]|uniref:Phosphatidylserine decarboxylase proenzyme 1, mitochondrial n=1 Tax=Hesseltinella vesiculosa TaxID=101127 RepID=A0A1X2GBS0_9FUNG|nr:phosphatidylserine decarboxylase [Hesseltinella vesiculosa]